MTEPADDIISVKAQIVSHLRYLTDERKLTQAEVRELMGLAAPEVSRIFEDGASEYSIERLMGFLTAFGLDVEITVRPHPKAGEGGKISLTLAIA